MADIANIDELVGRLVERNRQISQISGQWGNAIDEALKQPEFLEAVNGLDERDAATFVENAYMIASFGFQKEGDDAAKRLVKKTAELVSKFDAPLKVKIAEGIEGRAAHEGNMQDIGTMLDVLDGSLIHLTYGTLSKPERKENYADCMMHLIHFKLNPHTIKTIVSTIWQYENPLRDVIIGAAREMASYERGVSAKPGVVFRSMGGSAITQDLNILYKHGKSIAVHAAKTALTEIKKAYDAALQKPLEEGAQEFHNPGQDAASQTASNIVAGFHSEEVKRALDFYKTSKKIFRLAHEIKPIEPRAKPTLPRYCEEVLREMEREVADFIGHAITYYAEGKAKDVGRRFTNYVDKFFDGRLFENY